MSAKATPESVFKSSQDRERLWNQLEWKMLWRLMRLSNNGGGLTVPPAIISDDGRSHCAVCGVVIFHGARHCSAHREWHGKTRAEREAN